MSDWSSDVCSSDLERRPKIPVPLFPDPQAEVDIVEGDAQPFIQPADLVVYRCSHHHTRRGDRAQSLRPPRSMLMPGVSARSSRLHMTSHATDSQHTAPVLAGVVRVVTHRAYHPDLEPQPTTPTFPTP